MDKPRIHRKSWNVEGDAHFLTFSTFQQQPFFKSDRICNWFLDVLGYARKRCPFSLFAYVIMPEHIHLVLRPGEGVSMRSILWHLKRPMTQKVLEWVQENKPEFLERMLDEQPNGKVMYRFWQRGGGYDRNLRSSSDVHEKIGYIHKNPVRRGLVDSSEKWLYSSAGDWVLGKPGSVSIDWEEIPDPC